jgi:hypothetical protein
MEYKPDAIIPPRHVDDSEENSSLSGAGELAT